MTYRKAVRTEMLKLYSINGKTWQFEEGEQPENAVEVKAVKPPETKAVKPVNKAVKPSNKRRKAVSK